MIDRRSRRGSILSPAAVPCKTEVSVSANMARYEDMSIIRPVADIIETVIGCLYNPCQPVP